MFLNGGVICPVNSVEERDLNLRTTFVKEGTISIHPKLGRQ